MLEYLQPVQSQNSVILSIALNLAMMLYVCYSIYLDKRKSIVFKVMFLIVLIFSTLTLILGL